MDVQLLIKTESSTNKPRLPEHYREIYASYTNKNYLKCLDIIEKVCEFHLEYNILKAACLIHMEKDLMKAHQILDEILLKYPNNAYTLYAKGLAFYHEENWEEAVENFEKARQLDASPDLERAEIMKFKAMQKMNEFKYESNPTSAPISPKSPQDSKSGGIRRFGCEICGHFFGKKFNLDRHNRSIHKRNTPEDFPNKSTTIEEQPSLKSEPTQDSAVSVTFVNTEAEQVPKKKRSKPNSLNLLGMKNRVKCNFCKKYFKRGSLSRHMIIHTGKKHHECATCHRSFFQKSDLIRHETIHSDFMAFECEVCSKKFRLKKNLQVHKRRHHFHQK